ncbi:MAG: hypothetical protein H0T89_14730 [Deltaproteobacteria bacterium]|nr:hypothetical protein [Deltaproteobacteria bacterium]
MKLARLIVFCALAACSAGDEAEEIGNDEPADYEVDPEDGKGDGVPATFLMNDVVGDDLFVGTMTVTQVQKFFERSPYGNRSWLADYSANGLSAAQLVIDASTAERVHPMMLLARMQVEASLVSKTVKPSSYRIDRALGCGCPDGGGCSASYRGFGAQLACGAKVMRRGYDESVAGTGTWRKGKTSRTLDPRNVTPVNHATASMYRYTPWVLVGSGGNWLVWNVTRKYVRHAETLGFL